MSRPRILVTAALLALLLGLAGAGCQQTSDAELPEDLLALVPDDAAILVTATSLDEFNAQWHALNDTATGPALVPEKIGSGLDIGALLAEKWPGFADVVAPDEPLAVAFGVPAPLTNQMDLTVVFAPLKGADAATLADGEPFVAQLSRGRYVALSTTGEYAPADSVTALARDRLPGVVNVAFDLAGILDMYRPMVEMGLSMAAMAGGDVGESGMSAAESQALLEMVRALMDSAHRCDVGFESDGQELRAGFRFDMVPGSPLVPGPQPDFASALALAAALPADADFMTAQALDQTRQMEVFSAFPLASLQRELADMPPEQREKFVAWFEGYLGMVEHLAVPMAMSETMAADGMVMNVVLHSDRSAETTAHVANQVNTLSEIGLGVALVPRQEAAIAGAQLLGWTVEIDPDALPIHDGPGDPGMGKAQAMQTINLLRQIVPLVRLARLGDVVVLSTEPDDAEFARLVTAAAAGGSPPRELADLAAKAGPAVRQVMSGDLAAMLAWSLSFSTEDPELAGAIGEHPIPCQAFITQEGPRVAMAGSIDLDGARAAVAGFQKMVSKGKPAMP